MKLLNNKGFTMVELIVVIIIIGVISGPLMYLFYDTQKDYIANMNKIDSQTKVDKTIKGIIEDLRQVESSEYISSTIPSIELFNGSSNTVITTVGTKCDGVVARTLDSSNAPKIVAYKYDSTAKVIYKYKSNGVTNIIGRDTTSGIKITLPANKETVLDNVDSFSIEINANGVYIISAVATPKAVGNVSTPSITITNKFIPRYISYSR